MKIHARLKLNAIAKNAILKGTIMQYRCCFIYVICTLICSGLLEDACGSTSIACVGNSITAGNKLSDTASQRYTSLLIKNLNTEYLSLGINNLDSPVIIANKGLSGRTMLKNGTQPYWKETATIGQIFTLKPNIITIMLGTNDTKPVNWSHYSSQFESDYTAMIDTFSSISSSPKIILCIPPPIFKVRTSASDTTTHSDSTMLYGIIPIIKKIAAAKSLPVIDTRTSLISRQNLFSDSLHPDSMGHKILADIFYEAIMNNETSQIYKIKFLWYGNAPDIIGTGADTTAKPFMHVYPVSSGIINTGAAVIICPGGGYDHLSIKKEGDTVGGWFAKNGITAFVLRYRYSPYRYPVPFNDAKRAMRTVRYFAADYGIDTTKIGIMGFSAGGHLASTVGTHFDNGNGDSLDPIEVKKSRPDFMALIYPVITMTGSYVHTGSRDSLFGTSPSASLLDSLSNQKWVTSQTPPTFIAHGDSDKSVPIQNSEMFDSACAANNVTHKLMIDPGKGHGYGMAGLWPDTLLTWMKSTGIIATTGIASPLQNKQGPAPLFISKAVPGKGIRFIFKSAMPHKLTIYSVTGKRVACFASSIEKEMLWNPPSKGMYIVRVAINGVKRTEKVNFTF
jgi:acetyl esterase/lipase/lysophospholipase L1-like esterase